MIKANCTRFASPEREAWETLLPAQIATRCRAQADAVIALAEDLPDASISYLETAEAWMQLADDIEWAAEKTEPSRTRATARRFDKVT